MNDFPLKHAVREPTADGRGRAPLLVLLHGLRSNELDLIQLAPSLDPRLFVVSARAPLQMGHGMYAWYNVEFVRDGGFEIDAAQAEASRRTVLAFVDRVVESYNVDPSRVFVAGFSQGAAMTLAAALSEPRKFAGAMALSGRLLPEARMPTASEDKLRGLPVLAVHGIHDTVIPVAHGRAIRDELSALPVELTYEEFDMAHEISAESMRVAAQWLSARLAAPDWRTAGAR
jgi:phospholipase/carboxylesterase